MARLASAPVEAGVVDHDQASGRSRGRMSWASVEQAEEREELLDDVEEPHHRVLAERVEQLAPGGGHAVAAEPGEADGWVEALQLADQVAPCRSPLGSPALMKTCIRAVSSSQSGTFKCETPH